MEIEQFMEMFERRWPVRTVRLLGHELRFFVPTIVANARSHEAGTAGSVFHEPETLAWIEEFTKGDVLLDVGANCGVYSLLAAARGGRVVALEPHPETFFILSRNVRLNRLGRTLSPLCVAASDATRSSQLFYSSTMAGSSGHHVDTPFFEDPPVPEEQARSVAALTVSIDDLVENFGVPCPNHIKIDVDGHEPKVLAGAVRTMRTPALRTMLVEIGPDPELRGRMFDMIEAAGLRADPDQIARDTLPDGPFAGYTNVIFRRVE